MASAAANVTVTTAATVLFAQGQDGGKCARFLLGVRGNSANGLLVNVSAIHTVDEWVGLPAGSSVEFADYGAGIGRVTAKGDGGSALVDWGVLTRTIRSHA